MFKSNLAAVALCMIAIAAKAQSEHFDSKALERVRLGSETDSDYFLRLLDQSITTVHSEHQICAHLGNAKSSADTVERKAKQINKRVCALIEPLNPSSKLSFNSKKSGKYSDNLCAPYWKDGKPPWEKVSKKADMWKDYGTRDFVPPSRSLMMEQGYAIMSPEEEKAYFEKIELIRNNSASICCGDGPEAQQCIGAMSAVGIHICKDEASEKDPSLPDPCMIGNGYYEQTHAEKTQILMQMTRDAKRSKRMRKELVEFIDEKFEPYFASDEVKALKVVPGEMVVSGRVVLSRYQYNGTPMQDDLGVMHEFMHACSAIRKQLDVKNDAPTGIASLETYLREWFETCELPPTASESFGGHMQHFKVNGLANCLARIAEKSTDPKSQVFTPKACPKEKIEEGFADAMTTLFSTPMFPDGYPNRVCHFVPSAAHPHPSEVTKCLIAHVPVYKKIMKEAYQCPTSSAR